MSGTVLVDLVTALSDPASWGGVPVEVRQTHISVVFLVGDRAYKLKKPVAPGFLDFSTPERRRHFCEEEVRLNRRLAPGVYLGVRPVVRTPQGPRVGGSGEVLDHVVEMIRLPDDATLEARLMRGSLDVAVLRSLGARLAAFHADAERGEHVDRHARYETVAGNARENFEQTGPHVGRTVSGPVWRRTLDLTERALASLRPLIERRAAEGRARDTHGDLRLEHVYLLDGRLVVIDCVEFAERFRYADPVADVAFLAMDLASRGRRDLAEVLEAAWTEASGDLEGARLFPFYRAYRSVVRAKVRGMQLAEPEIPDRQRRRARDQAARHWLVALDELEEPARRPALLGAGGLPGTGKTTLALALAERAGFEVIRTDVVRKELAGLDPAASAASTFGTGLYTRAWDDRTYAACLERAEAVVRSGGRVLIDASFRDADRREQLLAAARRLGVRTGLLVCTASRETVARRLAARSGDASDADLAIHDAAAARWAPPTEETGRHWHEVSTEGGDAVERAVDALRAIGLA